MRTRLPDKNSFARRAGAFTLVEMLITMVTTTIVLGGALAAYLYGLKMVQFTQPKLSASDDARKAVALDSRQPTDTPVNTSATAFAMVATAPGCALQDLELESIRNTLHACKGNVSLAAKQLNISRNTIYRKLKPSAIDVTLPH